MLGFTLVYTDPLHVNLLVVSHGTNGFSFSSASRSTFNSLHFPESIKHPRQSLRPDSLKKPLDIRAGQVTETLEAEGRVFDDDGAGEAFVSGNGLFGGDFF